MGTGREAGTVAALAGELLDDLDRVTDRLTERILAEAKPYESGEVVPLEDLRRSLSDNLAEVLSALAGERPVNPEAPLATGRRRAEQGFPLTGVLHAFRLGAQLIWDELVERARARGAAGMADLVDGGRTLWTMIDDYSLLATDAYQERQSELARLDAERRTLVVDSVLVGLAAENPSLPEAAAALGLPLHGSFVVVSAEPAGAEAVERAVADELRGRGGTAVWRLRADRHVGVVSLGSTVTPARLRTALEAIAPGRVGLSPPYGELTGTPEALRLADIARHCLPPGTAGVAGHDDHPVRALLASDADAGRRAARTVLGPVLALEPEPRTLLLSTLRAWFEAGGSAAEAGRQLYCHRNTVRNRLQRLEELTGRSLDDPQGLAELFVASEASTLLGPSPRDGEV